jgi:capsid protein
VPLLANAIEPLKQLTRLSEAQLMNALVAAFFTVFVRSTGGITPLAAAMTPEEVVLGGGQYGPQSAPTSAVRDDSANDLEMGNGNVTYLDENQDITIADPRKVDTGFSSFWEALGNQVTAAGGMPFEKAMMKYTTSYTAARAAAVDSWKGVKYWRGLLEKRLCKVAYAAIMEEGILRGRMLAPGFFDNALKRAAWLGSYWIGHGQGALNPLQEAKATEVDLKNLTTTREEAYLEKTGGRWDAAMNKRARENRLLDSLGIVPEEDRKALPAYTETVDIEEDQTESDQKDEADEMVDDTE